MRNIEIAFYIGIAYVIVIYCLAEFVSHLLDTLDEEEEQQPCPPLLQFKIG
jgi:hypothetical protein